MRLAEVQILDDGFFTMTAMPMPPAGVATSVSGDDVTLTWDDPLEQDVRYFNIYRGTVSGSLTLYDTYAYYGENWRDIIPTQWRDMDQASNTYYYEVTFVNYDGVESLPSTEVSATVP